MWFGSVKFVEDNGKDNNSLIMRLLDRLNRKDWIPKSRQVDKQELKLLLSSVERNTFFCWHNWVYWTYGIATRQHRVCKKCYKKEKNADVINKWNRWIDE